MALPDDPTLLQTTFFQQPLSTHLSKWDGLYEQDVTPWDRGGPSPALEDVLLQRKDLLPPPPSNAGRRRTALVSGCGRGHDVLLLAAFGYDAYGIDYSPLAIQRARAVADVADPTVYRARDEALGKGAVSWVEADWFKFDFAREVGVEQFDLIFDYTFLCALPPSARPDWARRTASLLSPNGGRLICLEFPNNKPLHLAGPPWGLRPSTYAAHLSRPGIEIPYIDGEVQADEAMSPAPDGLKRLALIVPPRTHPCGLNEDGTVHDRISVWSH